MRSVVHCSLQGSCRLHHLDAYNVAACVGLHHGYQAIFDLLSTGAGQRDAMDEVAVLGRDVQHAFQAARRAAAAAAGLVEVDVGDVAQGNEVARGGAAAM